MPGPCDGQRAHCRVSGGHGGPQLRCSDQWLVTVPE
jgi:hypothetical protein